MPSTFLDAGDSVVTTADKNPNPHRGPSVCICPCLHVCAVHSRSVVSDCLNMDISLGAYTSWKRTLKKYIFIYLFAPGFYLQHTNSLVVACGIQFPDQGSNPGPLHWEHGVPATGPPGKSQNHIL